jgi:hypothetical protein
VSVHRSNDEYNRQILEAVASGRRITQRSLSGDMGVALGLTNLLIRRLAAKGYISIAGFDKRHVEYLRTPAGWAALGDATRSSIEHTVRLYTQTRELIRASLEAVSRACAIDGSGQKRIVFYGAGDVAEIAYVSLQSTDLTLVGVVDDRRRGRFFEVTISGPDDLSADGLGDERYAHVVVTSVRHADAIAVRLDGRAVSRSRVTLLGGQSRPGSGCR